MKAIFSVLLLVATLALSSCNGKNQASDTVTSAAESTVKHESGKVEVVYFHGAQKCVTCKAIGKLSQELVDSINNPEVAWIEVDLSTPEGEKFGDKYELTGSGLMLVNGDKHANLTEMAFRYARKDPEKFKEELNNEIAEIRE